MRLSNSLGHDFGAGKIDILASAVAGERALR